MQVTAGVLTPFENILVINKVPNSINQFVLSGLVLNLVSIKID
jgi:hypothetical protein